MVRSRVVIRVTPFRALITLLITYLLSPLGLQVSRQSSPRCRSWGRPRSQIEPDDGRSLGEEYPLEGPWVVIRVPLTVPLKGSIGIL